MSFQFQIQSKKNVFPSTNDQSHQREEKKLCDNHREMENSV